MAVLTTCCAGQSRPAPEVGSQPWPNEPAGFTVTEETGWESDNLRAWYRVFESADKSINIATIGDSPIGESKALQIGFAAGHVGGGGTELRYDIAPQDQRNEIYVGYYVQVSPEWQGHESAINKMIYLHDGGSSQFSAMWYEMFGAGDASLDLYVVNQSGSGPEGMRENVNEITFTRGKWHRVEIYQKQGASNGIVRVWVDGVQAIDRSDVGTRSRPIDNITISGIWGGVDDRKRHDDYMRFDRIRISKPAS